MRWAGVLGLVAAPIGALLAGASCGGPLATVDAGVEASTDAPPTPDVGEAGEEDAPHGDIPLRLAGWSAARAPEYNLPGGSQVKALRATIRQVFDVTWRPLASLDVSLAASNADGIVLTTYGGTFGTIDPALGPSEQAALRAFVDAGHFAILLLDNDGYGGPIDPYNDSLANPLGLDAIGTVVADGGYVNASAVASDAGLHPIVDGVPSFPQYFPGWLGARADAGVAPVVAAENPSGPALVVVEKGALGPGSGVVIAFSDTGSFTDDAPAGLTAAAQKVFVQALRYAAGK